MQTLEAKEAEQSFAYEIRGDSAVIWRCFSRDTKAEVPARMAGYPVTEIAPYAFSAHMEARELEKQVRTGRVRIYLSPLMRMELQEEKTDTEQSGKMERQPGTEDESAALLERLPQLCGNQVEEIVLPDSVRRIGRYCFYNCGQLHRLEFSGELADWGSGVFTGCHQIRRLRVRAEREAKLYLKDMLDELMEELEVDFVEALQTDAKAEAAQAGQHKMRKLYARLWFPEFYEEGVENTPARILETHVHGSGIRYRNCFQGRKFDFGQYDVLFPHAVAQESAEFLARMVMGRLRLPCELSDKAKQQYTAYAKEHARELATLLLNEYDMEGIEWLLLLTEGKNEALIDHMMELASKKQLTEATGYLMNYRRLHARVRRRRYEL